MSAKSGGGGSRDCEMEERRAEGGHGAERAARWMLQGLSVEWGVLERTVSWSQGQESCLEVALLLVMAASSGTQTLIKKLFSLGGQPHTGWHGHRSSYSSPSGWLKASVFGMPVFLPGGGQRSDDPSESAFC